jgi:hypothetical protein
MSEKPEQEPKPQLPSDALLTNEDLDALFAGSAPVEPAAAVEPEVVAELPAGESSAELTEPQKAQLFRLYAKVFGSDYTLADFAKAIKDPDQLTVDLLARAEKIGPDLYIETKSTIEALGYPSPTAEAPPKLMSAEQITQLDKLLERSGYKGPAAAAAERPEMLIASLCMAMRKGSVPGAQEYLDSLPEELIKSVIPVLRATDALAGEVAILDATLAKRDEPAAQTADRPSVNKPDRPRPRPPRTAAESEDVPAIPMQPEPAPPVPDIPAAPERRPIEEFEQAGFTIGQEVQLLPTTLSRDIQHLNRFVLEDIFYEQGNVPMVWLKGIDGQGVPMSIQALRARLNSFENLPQALASFKIGSREEALRIIGDDGDAIYGVAANGTIRYTPAPLFFANPNNRQAWNMFEMATGRPMTVWEEEGAGAWQQSPIDSAFEELAARGITEGSEVYLLPPYAEVERIIAQISAGQAVDEIEVPRYKFAGVSYDGATTSLILESPSGETEINQSESYRLYCLTAGSDETATINGEECVLLARINGYIMGMSPDGKIRYQALDSAPQSEEPEIAPELGLEPEPEAEKSIKAVEVGARVLFRNPRTGKEVTGVIRMPFLDGRLVVDEIDNDGNGVAMHELTLADVLDFELDWLNSLDTTYDGSYILRENADGSRLVLKEYFGDWTVMILPAGVDAATPIKMEMALPAYYIGALRNLFLQQDAATGEQKLHDFLACTEDEERLKILDEVGLIDRSGDAEVDQRVMQIIHKLQTEAASKLGPGMAERAIGIAKKTQEVWTGVRKWGLSQWARQGSRLAQFSKSALLGAGSGVALRLGTAAAGFGAAAGVPLSLVSGIMSGVGFTGLAFDKIERHWQDSTLDEKVRRDTIRNELTEDFKDPAWLTAHGFQILPAKPEQELPEGTVRFGDSKGKTYIFNPQGRRLPKVLRAEARSITDRLEAESRQSGAWVEDLPTPELMRRVAEAQIYLTRREARTDQGVVNNSAEEIKLYSDLVRESIKRRGEGAVVATIEDSFRRNTSNRQVAKAVAIGGAAALGTAAAGYWLSHKAMAYLNEHVFHASPAPAGSPPQSAGGASETPSANHAPSTPAATPESPPSSAAPSAPAVEWHLNPEGGYSPVEIQKVAETWVTAHSPEVPPSMGETQLAEHFVRADMAQKLGLWHENSDHTGTLVGDWKVVSETTDPVTGVKHVVEELVNPTTQNGVDLSKVRLVDGQFDFSQLNLTTNDVLAKSIDAGPWQTAWGNFREGQILERLGSDEAVAKLSGVPVESLRAHPDLLTHLREQATSGVKAQLEVGPNGKALPVPVIGGRPLPLATNTVDILSVNGSLAGALHNEANEWADQNGVQLITRPVAPAATSVASAAGGARSNSYQGWGTRPTASVQPEPGQAGYKGWGDRETLAQALPDKANPPLGQPVPLEGETVRPEPQTTVSQPVAAEPTAADVVEPSVAPESAPPQVGVPSPLKPGEQLGGSVEVDTEPATPAEELRQDAINTIKAGEKLGGPVTVEVPK